MKKLLTRIASIGLLLGAIQAQATELTVSTWLPMGHHINAGILEPYAQKIEQVTQGRVTVKFLPKALGAPAAHFDIARKGLADITWSNFTYEPKRFASFTLFELPLLSNSSEVNSQAAWNTINKYYIGRLKSLKDIVLLGVMQVDPGMINSRAEMLVKPADFVGKKIRTGGPVQVAILEKTRGVAVAAPQSKSYELLSTGVADGTFANSEALDGFKLFEVVKNQTEVKGGVYNGIFFIAMNKRRFWKLSKQDQQAILGISGSVLSKAAGQDWDKAAAKGHEVSKQAGVIFSPASPELMTLIRSVKADQEAIWKKAARQDGLANPDEVMDYFYSEISRLDPSFTR